MKTKVVYAITSTVEDVFWEQLWASVWSLKYHNPDAHVIVITDKETYDGVKSSYRNASLKLIDEIIPVEFERSYTKKRRSRWIKIKARELVRGDILYIDSDTVITSDLSEVDTFDFDMGMVYDMHEHPRPMPLPFIPFKNAYGIDLAPDAVYYNGGLFYAKDTDLAREFFNNWYDNWVLPGDKLDYKDQHALAKTVIEMGNPVTPLSGVYNCQPLSGIRYLNTAKIVHFFNNQWLFPTTIHPFLQKETYRRIKESKGLSDEFKHLILCCRSEFTPISSPIGIDEAMFIRSNLVQSVYYLYGHKKNVFNMLNKLSRRLGLMLYRFHVVNKPREL